MKPLSHAECEKIWQYSEATELPQGTYKGIAWSEDLPWVRAVSKVVWQGKVFKVDFLGGTVKNIILGKRRIEGTYSLQWDEVIIDYPQLGLQDRLKPMRGSDGVERWLLRTKLGTSEIWGMLEKEEEA